MFSLIQQTPIIEEVFALNFRPLPHHQGKFCLNKHDLEETGSFGSNQKHAHTWRSLLSKLPSTSALARGSLAAKHISHGRRGKCCLKNIALKRGVLALTQKTLHNKHSRFTKLSSTSALSRGSLAAKQISHGRRGKFCLTTHRAEERSFGSNKKTPHNAHSLSLNFHPHPHFQG